MKLSHLLEPHAVQMILRRKCSRWFIFSFAEETSICSWMGLAGSQIEFALILKEKEELRRRVAVAAS